MAFRVVGNARVEGDEVETTKSSATSRRMSFDSLLQSEEQITEQ